MPRITSFLALFMFCLAVPAFAGNNSVTLTTYYPAPTGNYIDIKTQSLVLDYDEKSVSTDDDIFCNTANGAPGKVYIGANGNINVCRKPGISGVSNASKWKYDEGIIYADPISGSIPAKIGLGTDYPQYLLDLGPGLGRKLALYDIGEDFYGFGISGAVADALEIYASTTGPADPPKMVIKSSGNVGIGETLPTEKLQILANRGTIKAGGFDCSAGYVGMSFNGRANGAPANNCGNYNILSGPDANLYLNRPKNASIYFRQNNVTEMIVDPNGNVGIGTTTLPAAKLDVAGNVRASGTLEVQSTAVLAQDSGASVNVGNTSPGGNKADLNVAGNATVEGNSTVTGTITSGEVIAQRRLNIPIGPPANPQEGDLWLEQ